MAVISDHQTLMNRVLGDPGNPEGELWVVRDAVAPPVAKLASVGAAPCVEVDALAQAASPQADPANRRLPVRAGRRERVE